VQWLHKNNALCAAIAHFEAEAAVVPRTLQFGASRNDFSRLHGIWADRRDTDWACVRADILTGVLEEDHLAPVAARSHVMRAAGDNDVRQSGHEPFMTQEHRGILPASVSTTHPSVARPGELTSRDKVRTVGVLNRG
jgi:hypothetical protein